MHNFCFNYLLSHKTSRYFVYAIDVGYAINTFTFPLIISILLSLNHFATQLRKTRIYPIILNIKKSLNIYNKVRKICLQIEDFASIIAFFLYGLCFTTVLYLVGKYSLIKHETLSTCSRISAVFPVLQMIIVCISVSKTVNHWQEIRQIAQDISQFHGIIYDYVRNKDMLLLWSLVEHIKIDLSFTCIGIFTLHWSLVLKSVTTTVTFGVLMLV